jgi:hypothetical protein
MSRYVCVVSRDHPTLAGYLMVALGADDVSSQDQVRVLLDRRREASEPIGRRRASGAERRRRMEIDAELRAHRFVVVPERPPAPLNRERELTPALALDDDRSRDPVRWPMILALGFLSAAVVAGVAALAPSVDVARLPRLADISRLIAPAPTPPPRAEAPPPLAPAAPEPAAPAPAHDQPAAPAGIPRASSPPRIAAADAERPQAAAGGESVTHAPAFPGLPRVELKRQRAGRGAGQQVVYTARVGDADGEPLVGAVVSLVAMLTDGGRREVRMAPTGAPGTYRGTMPAGTRPQEERVRVAVDGRRFEVPVPR